MKTKFSVIPVFAILVVLAGCGAGHSGCGGSGVGATDSGNSSSSGSGATCSTGVSNSIPLTTFVYFADPDAGQLALEGLNVAGSNTFASVSNFATPTVSLSASFVSMAVVSEKYLYVSADASPLYGFSIDGTTGALTAVTNSPYSVPGDSMAADPSGRFLFAGDAEGIHVFTVNSDGSLTEAPGSPFSNDGILPTQLVTDGLGKYLYALSGSTITEFSYNQTSGVLTPVALIAPNLSMIASEKTGTYILGIADGAAEIHVYAIGTTGALAELSGSPFATTQAPVYFAVDPNGAFVYTFNWTGGFGTEAPMEGYTLGSDGSLTVLSSSPFSGLNADIGMFDQSGNYVFAVAEAGSIGEQFAYTVNTSTGALSSVLSSAGAAGTYVVTDAP
jgi:6-phosphogluconolactonase